MGVKSLSETTIPVRERWTYVQFHHDDLAPHFNQTTAAPTIAREDTGHRDPTLNLEDPDMHDELGQTEDHDHEVRT